MALNAQQQQDYADFVRRFEADPSSISGEEAARRYQELINLASPEEARAAQAQAFAQIAPEGRRTLAGLFQDAHNDPSSPFNGYQFDNTDQAAEPHNLGRMAFQAGEQDQSTLGRILNSPLGRMAMAAIAAYLARRMFGGQQGGDSGLERQAGGGLDLGKILGALAQAQGGGQASGQAGGQGGLDIGAILGALAQAQAQGGGQAGGQAGGGMPDLGGLLDALGGAQAGGQGTGQAGGAPASGQPDLSSLLSGQGSAQANSELGRILTSLGEQQPSQEKDDKKGK